MHYRCQNTLARGLYGRRTAVRGPALVRQFASSKARTRSFGQDDDARQYRNAVVYFRRPSKRESTMGRTRKAGNEKPAIIVNAFLSPKSKAEFDKVCDQRGMTIKSSSAD